jgi:ribosomal protein S18 acetylase RimI-like enzyme
MTLDDVPQVFRIGDQYFENGEILIYGIWSLAEVVHHFTAWGELCFVAEEDGHLIGFALGGDHYVNKRMGHLNWIAVAPERQRQGVGTKLADAVYKAMSEQGLAYAVSDTKGSDPGPLAFFGEHLGLKSVAVVNFFKKPL